VTTFPPDPHSAAEWPDSASSARWPFIGSSTMPAGMIPRAPQGLVLALALIWSSSCELQLRTDLAAALGVEWEQVATLQAQYQLALAETEIVASTDATLQSVQHLDAVTTINATVGATLSSVQYLDLDPTVIGWAAQTSLVLVEQSIGYLDLDPTVIDWHSLAALVSVGMGQFGTAVGWSGAAVLEAVCSLDLSPRTLVWGASSTLSVAKSVDAPGSTNWTPSATLSTAKSLDAPRALTWTPSATLSTAKSLDAPKALTWTPGASLSTAKSLGAPRTLAWTPSAALTALLGLSCSPSWTWGASCTLLATRLLDLSTRTITWSPSCTLELVPAGVVFVGSNTAAATSVAVPSGHTTGDLMIMFTANSSGLGSLPGLGSGWTSLRTGGTFGAAARLAYRYATSSSESAVTWSGASVCAISVYRGATLGVDGWGGTANSWPALSGFSADAWLYRVAYGAGTTLNAPSGFTSRASLTSGSYRARQCDTDGPYGSTSIAAATISPSAITYVSTVAIEPA